MSNFTLGLQITGLGMGLVFLTLLIVMAVIWALDRIFRPPGATTTEAPAQQVDTAALQMQVPETATGKAAASEQADGADQAAAVAVAIALAQRGAAVGSARLMQVSRARSRMPWETLPDEIADEEVTGEIITVMPRDAGSHVWKNQGRLRAME